MTGRGAHPAHGGAQGLCQAPQAAEILLEAAELQGGCLVEAAALLAGPHLLLPQVGAGDQEQVTEQELDRLQGQGDWGEQGVGQTDGGARRSLRAGAAARDPRRAAWQGHCTPSLTHAMQLQCTPARVGGTSRQGWGGSRPPRPSPAQLTLSMVPLGGLPSSRLSRRQLLAFSQWLRVAWLPSCLLSKARTARKECRAARGRGFLKGGGDMVTADPSLCTAVPFLNTHQVLQMRSERLCQSKGGGRHEIRCHPCPQLVSSTHSEFCSARGMVSTSG